MSFEPFDPLANKKLAESSVAALGEKGRLEKFLDPM
jgi:hypothetical protein